jgi:YVTN family beta-propeller protein
VFDEWLFWWWWVTPSGGTVKPCGAAGSPYGLVYNGSAKKLFVSCASVGGGSVDTAVVYSVSDGGVLTEIARNALDPGGTNGGMVALGNWGNILFTNSASGTLNVIGDLSNQVVGKLTTGGDPFGMAVDPVYGTVYVGDRGGNRLLVFRDDYVASLRAGNGIAVNPNTGWLYVTSRDNGFVIMLNGTTHSVNAVLTVGGRPWGIAINPTTKRVYAASFDTNKLAVINAGGMELIAGIPVGVHSTFVDVNRNTNRVFVVNHDNNLLWVIDGATNKVLPRFPNGLSTGGGKGAWGLAVNPTLNRVYVAHRDSGELVTFDGTNDKWTLLDDQTIRGCRRGLPFGMAFNPVNNELYVTCATGLRPNDDVNHVDIYDAEADGLKWRVELPLGHGGSDGGGGIAVDTATGNVLFTNSADNSVTIVSRTDRVIKTMYVGLDPFGATADPVTRRFHVALRLGNNVINIDDSVSDPYRSYVPMLLR